MVVRSKLFATCNLQHQVFIKSNTRQVTLITFVSYTLSRHRRRRVLPSFYPSVRLSVYLSVPNSVTTLTLYEFPVSAWHMVGWCTISWSRSRSKELWKFHDRFRPNLRDDVTAITRFQMVFTNDENDRNIWWNSNITIDIQRNMFRRQL